MRLLSSDDQSPLGDLVDFDQYHESIAAVYGMQVPDQFDILFGIYEFFPPLFIQTSYTFLFVTWILYYAVACILTSIKIRRLVVGVSPRSAVTLGAVYQFVDPWYVMLPRFFTCGFLHFNLLHLGANLLSTVATFLAWTRATDAHPAARWMDYYVFPVWLGGVFLGSVMSYLTSLKTRGSFTIGASGGCLALSSCFFIMSLKLKGVSLLESSSSTILNFANQIVPLHRLTAGIQPKMKAYAKDTSAHFGGAVIGIMSAVGFLMFLDEFGDPRDPRAIRRFGAVLTCVGSVITVVSFLVIYIQAFMNNADRVGTCYLLWMKVAEKRNLMKPSELRRWTLAQVEQIPEAWQGVAQDVMAKARKAPNYDDAFEDVEHVKKLQRASVG